MFETKNVDSKGNFLIYDVREDEEQIAKMNEISELLLAGGYFRARIKGLHNFDKVWILYLSLNVSLIYCFVIRLLVEFVGQFKCAMLTWMLIYSTKRRFLLVRKCKLIVLIENEYLTTTIVLKCIN